MKNILQNQDIPALMGLDTQQSRWHLWHLCKGDIQDLPDSKQTLKEALRGSLVEWIQKNSTKFFDCQAEIPTIHPQSKKELPLVSVPDLVINEQPAWGQGFGVVRIFHIERSQWHQEWHPGSMSPLPPAAATADLQACMMASGAQWGLALPVTGIYTVKSPLLCIPEPSLVEKIEEEIQEFFRSVEQNVPPRPDSRSGRDMMQALESISSRPATDPIALPNEVENLAKSAIESYESAFSRLETSREERQELASIMENDRMTLADIAREYGSFNLDGKTITVKTEDIPPPVIRQRILLEIEENVT